MTSFNKILGIALAFAGAGMIASCSSESSVNGEPENGNVTSKMSFVKAPELKMWSGSEIFTRAGEEDGEDVTDENATLEEDKTGWPEGWEPAREGVYNKGHVKGHDEVEVNLAVNDTHEFVVNDEDGNPTTEAESVNDLVTKLSIHVRYPHDVKVRIPVPMEYVVPVDDMAIVLSHQYEDEQYKAEVEERSMTWSINGHNVTLHVAYYAGPAAEGVDFAEMDSPDYANGYICVWTEGVTQEVLDYTYETYGDGVNFEVWNYYNKPEETIGEGEEAETVTYPAMTEEQLFQYVNNSSVEFSIDQNGEERDMPDAYINAFTKHTSTATGLNKDGKRCDAWVYITGDGALNNNVNEGQILEYPEGYKESYHLNGKAFNHIYKKYVEPVEEDEDEVVED